MRCKIVSLYRQFPPLSLFNSCPYLGRFAQDWPQERNPARQLDGVVVEAAAAEGLGEFEVGPNRFVPNVSSGDAQQAECRSCRSEQKKSRLHHHAGCRGGGGGRERERERALLFLWWWWWCCVDSTPKRVVVAGADARRALLGVVVPV